MFDITHYHAVRRSAALVDRSDRGRLLLTGADRASYLQGLLTNDIKALGPGGGCYAAWLTPQGRMIADLRVFELGEAMLVVLAGHVKDAVRDRLEQLVFSEDVQVADLAGTWAGFGLYGPTASRVLAAAMGGGQALADHFAALRPFQNERRQIDAAWIVVAASDEIGIGGFDLFVERAHADALRACVTVAGAIDVAPDAVNVVRVESGVPEFGADMDPDTIPLEAGIEDRAISFTKGCYVGQEVIVRVRDRGQGRVVRRLVGLRIDGAEVPRGGDRIFAGERDVGRLTSAVLSPALGRPIALGYVHRDFVEEGTELGVLRGDSRLRAVVATLPFVPSAES